MRLSGSAEDLEPKGRTEGVSTSLTRRMISGEWEAVTQLIVDELETEDLRKMAKVVRGTGSAGKKVGEARSAEQTLEERRNRYVEKGRQSG